MRRIALLLVVLVVSALQFAPARASSILVQRDLGAGAFVSANVEYLGTIPIEAIGGRVLKVGNQTRFYVTGAPGLFIYDITNPAIPVPLGALPLPHFQNEDADVSDDGSRVIIATDTAHAGPDGRAGTGSIRVIDTSNPAMPRVTGFIASGNHTAMCVDPACTTIYGSSGNMYRVDAAGAITDAGKNWGPGSHALNRDETGLVISDQSPRRVLDVSDPLNPTILATGAPKPGDGLLQHNNVRVGAASWQPRNPDGSDDGGPMRPGELLVGNSESNVRPSCTSTVGGLTAWDMRNFDRGTPMKQLNAFRPVNGNWADGNPAVNALGCSGHWFTVRNNTVAAAWYEHGIRFIDVDPATGAFTQKGYFQPVVTEAGSAHWTTDAAGNEFVLTTDYARGIDILRYTRGADVPSQAEFDASWLANLGKTGATATAERYQCRLAREQAARNI